MFYDSDDSDCNAFTPIFETVAHRLRGLLNAGRVDKSISDDVTERFRIDDNQCPTFLLYLLCDYILINFLLKFGSIYFVISDYYTS